MRTIEKTTENLNFSEKALNNVRLKTTKAHFKTGFTKGC